MKCPEGRLLGKHNFETVLYFINLASMSMLVQHEVSVPSGPLQKARGNRHGGKTINHFPEHLKNGSRALDVECNTW